MKMSIDGLRMLLEEDHKGKDSIEHIIKRRLNGLDELADDGDEEARQYAKMHRNLLRESNKHSIKISKLEEQEEMYLDLLRRNTNQSSKNLILKKLEDIEKQKKSFK
jgi:hypothetical protein